MLELNRKLFRSTNPIERVVSSFKELTELRARKVCMLTLLDLSEELWGELMEDLLHCVKAQLVVSVVPGILDSKDDATIELTISMMKAVLNGTNLRGVRVCVCAPLWFKRKRPVHVCC